ncbi:MAG: hypothetical protein IJ424_04750 [Oscillospiraceae bacterium]|nr:hypothetical protein [Oscillospiraceae bacterium]
MNKLFALALVAVMLLATGCQNKQPTEINNADTQVTDAAGTPQPSENNVVAPAVSDDSEQTEESENTNDSEEIKSDDLNYTEEVTPPALLAPSRTTEMYLTYSIELDGDGNTKHIAVYEYDKHGNQTKRTIDSNDIEVCEYNNDGLLTKSMVYSQNVLKSYIELGYDKNGNITSYRTFNPNGTVNYGKYDLNYDAKYDSKNRIVERIRYDSQDDYTVTTIEYNNAGLVVREKCISSNGMLLTMRQHEYDDKGRMTTWLYLDTQNPKYDHNTTTTYVDNADGSYTATTTYTDTDMVIGFEAYDKNGNIVQQHSYLNDELYNKHFHTFDENSNCTYSKTLNADGAVVSESSAEYTSDGTMTYSIRTDYTYNNDGTSQQTTTETIVEFSKATDSDDYAYIKKIIEKANGELIFETVTYFDDKDNCIRNVTKSEKTINEEVYERDADGNVLQISYYSDGKLISSTVNEYVRIEGAVRDILEINT